LNDLIEVGGTNGPFSFSNINFTLNEEDSSGTEATNFFECLDSAGNPCNDNSNVLKLISVVDGFNNDRTKQFALFQNPSILDQFQVKSNSEFIFNHDASVRENYTFFIEATANGQTNTLSFTGSLSNTAPTNVSFPNYNRVNTTSGLSYFLIPTVNVPIDLIAQGEIKNGSIIASRVSEELLYSIEFVHIPNSTDYQQYFNYYTLPDGTLKLEYLGGLSGANLFEGFKLRIKDANGNGLSFIDGSGNDYISFNVLTTS